MDPLSLPAGLPVFGALAKTISTAKEFCQVAREIHRNQMLPENRDLLTIANHFDELTLRTTAQCQDLISEKPDALPEEQSLLDLVNGCRALDKQLIDLLQDSAYQPGEKPTIVKSVHLAFKAMRSMKDVEAMTRRLEYFKTEMLLDHSRLHRADAAKVDIGSLACTINHIISRLDRLESNTRLATEQDKASIVGSASDNQAEIFQHQQTTLSEMSHLLGDSATEATASTSAPAISNDQPPFDFKGGRLRSYTTDGLFSEYGSKTEESFMGTLLCLSRSN